VLNPVCRPFLFSDSQHPAASPASQRCNAPGAGAPRCNDAEETACRLGCPMGKLEVVSDHLIDWKMVIDLQPIPHAENERNRLYVVEFESSRIPIYARLPVLSVIAHETSGNSILTALTAARFLLPPGVFPDASQH